MSKRTSVIRIRVTPEEHAAIISAAETIGLGPCSFARMSAVKAAGRKPAKPPRRRPDAYAQALAGWTAQLGWLGNNLNQCARVLNSGGSVERAMLAGIRAELAQLREVVVAFDREAE
ncbi:hypothetical protein V1291_000837 [Nitrobacteraceae bacterium AZCC 1564]